MKKIIYSISVFLFICPALVSGQKGVSNVNSGWKAGVSSAMVTPDKPMNMGGFGFRNKPSEGHRTDLYVKALAFEDAKGNRAVIVTFDLNGIFQPFSDQLRDRLHKKYNLSRSQIILNVSHTHSGPSHYTPRMDTTTVLGKRAKEYTDQLANHVIEIVGNALQTLQPVKIFSGNGVARFQVNRRNNIQAQLHLLSKFNGPNDDAVPVIKVQSASGKILAILFGYACHASMLKDYIISGDYPAYARMELEKLYPGTTSLFFQGAGGNQIGYPRNTVENTMQWGKTLAASVERVISEPMKELSPDLATTYDELNLDSDQEPPTKDELLKIAENKNNPDSIRIKARENLDKLERGETLIPTYPFPIQVWKVGELPLITMGGEPMVEYAIKLKLIFGQDAFVFGYSNDVMAYIGTPKTLTEGGYEGNSSPFRRFRGARWSQNIEPMIINGVLKLAKQAGVEMAPKKYSIPGG